MALSMLSTSKDYVFILLDFKAIWLSQRHSQSFHFGKVCMSIPSGEFIHIKEVVPKTVIENAKKNFRNVKRWVRTIFDVQCLTQMGELPYKKVASLTLALMEDAHVYMTSSLKFPSSGKVMMCTVNASN